MARSLSAHITADFEPGDFVRRVGMIGVGTIRSVDAGFAVVIWDKDNRDILPLGVLRRVPAGGSRWDAMP